MIKSIISNIKELRKPCEEVKKDENIKDIIQDLKDTLATKKGYALAANQIGINKKIAYCKIPKLNMQEKKLEYSEYVLINPKIVEKERKYIHKQEGCLSFPGLRIDTDRYVFIVVQFLNENFQPQTAVMQDLEAAIVQHECDHIEGRTIFDRKHKRR